MIVDNLNVDYSGMDGINDKHSSYSDNDATERRIIKSILSLLDDADGEKDLNFDIDSKGKQLNINKKKIQILDNIKPINNNIIEKFNNSISPINPNNSNNSSNPINLNNKILHKCDNLPRYQEFAELVKFNNEQQHFTHCIIEEDTNEKFTEDAIEKFNNKMRDYPLSDTPLSFKTIERVSNCQTETCDEHNNGNEYREPNDYIDTNYDLIYSPNNHMPDDTDSSYNDSMNNCSTNDNENNCDITIDSIDAEDDLELKFFTETKQAQPVSLIQPVPLIQQTQIQPVPLIQPVATQLTQIAGTYEFSYIAKYAMNWNSFHEFAMKSNYYLVYFDEKLNNSGNIQTVIYNKKNCIPDDIELFRLIMTYLSINGYKIYYVLHNKNLTDNVLLYKSRKIDNGFCYARNNINGLILSDDLYVLEHCNNIQHAVCNFRKIITIK